MVGIASSTETGRLNVMHLKRLYEKCLLKKQGALAADALTDEWQTDVILLNALGLGLEQAIQQLYSSAGSFEDFEAWIVRVTGGPDPVKIAQFNATFAGGGRDQNNGQEEENVLNRAGLDFWDENGYVIIRNAVSKQDCDDTIALICNEIGVDRHDSSTWYAENKLRQGIMVQLFQHPLLQKNRTAFRIRRAFEQVWGRTDIWVNTDRVGFNPPETESHPFQGPRLHWDCSIKQPIPFGTQGILYLADTAENQGAFTLVPGFQHKIGDWLNSLPDGANPRQQDLYALGPKPIAANAGDFILWRQALPHGSSPNKNVFPRFVQYVNYEPLDRKESDEWL